MKYIIFDERDNGNYFSEEDEEKTMKAFYVIVSKRNGSWFISAFDTKEEAEHFLTAEDIKKGDIVERSTDYDFSDEEWDEMIENDYRKEA